MHSVAVCQSCGDVNVRDDYVTRMSESFRRGNERRRWQPIDAVAAGSGSALFQKNGRTWLSRRGRGVSISDAAAK